MANNILVENYIEDFEIVTPLQHNLLQILKNEGPLTRKQLVNELNTPRTTIYDNLVKLQKQKVVEKFSRNNGKRGRPKVYWKISE
ncbi:MAG: Sugar-specific transcriptional regulator TrmB [Promethearchaeota archaeon]|jgi:predicted ArsR family transcriptional regulator|nr:MAG: Sugar-specific transcriptional regulator TrmB [Candidatus Lokiarchaeota archaeon]